MKSLVYFLLFVGALVGAGIAGCGQPPRPIEDKPKTDIKSTDPWKTARTLFRQTENMRGGDEWSRFRAGCDLLKGHFSKPETLKSMRDRSVANRAFLEADVHLSAGELAEVERTSFRGPDAHYLDECYLLADVAKTLEVSELSPAANADISFRWVMRNILPHEQGDSWTPPAYTLRRGYGSTLQRALVFLALLRQSGLDGCLIVVPETDAEPKQFLVAALDSKETRLYLFDPRLGLPLLSKDGNRVLTLAEALDEPALLQPALITEAQAKQLQAWLVCPLYALSARMHELQRGLTARGESVVLHLDAAELSRDIAKAAKLTIKVWNPPAVGKTLPNSPTRSLRLFLPGNEGGVDETNRALRFVYARYPTEYVRANLAQLNLTRGPLVEPAYDILIGLSQELVNLYDLQPREMYLRGDFGAVSSRHERLQLFAQNETLDRLVGDATFVKEVETWRRAVEKAQLDEKAKVMVLNMVGQDHFLRFLIEVDKKEKLDDRTMSVLTRILAVGLRDHLAAELAHVQAAGNHERAEHAQAIAAAPKAAPALKTEARDVWAIAKNSWENSYLETFLVQAKLKQKLKQLQQARVDQISLLETLHLEAQKYFDARLRLAECMDGINEAQAARASRLATKDQIDAMQKEGLLLAEIRRLQGFAQPGDRKRLDLLARDWSEQGHYFWMKRQIDRLTGDRAKK